MVKLKAFPTVVGPPKYKCLTIKIHETLMIRLYITYMNFMHFLFRVMHLALHVPAE